MLHILHLTEYHFFPHLMSSGTPLTQGLRAVHTENDHCKINRVSVRTDERQRSVNGGTEHTLHAPAVSAA